MKKEAYVVMEVGWEYNDEVYHRGESGGGRPYKVFTSKKKADEEAIKKSLTEFKALFGGDRYNDIRGYAYDLDEIVDVNADTIKLFADLFGQSPESWWDDECPSPKNMTDDKWVKLYKCFDLPFFEVIEVDSE